jgi:hypothetical protein
MSTPDPAAGPLAIDLNQPGTYLNWSIFNVSVANLVLIAVMVVIFGAARCGEPVGVGKGTGSQEHNPEKKEPRWVT